MKHVCYLTRIKDEEKLIYYQLIYYYNLGIRNFYITFNNSNDITKKIVNKFIDNHQNINFFPYYENNTEYNQIEMFDKMSDDAFYNGHVWQIPSDADELLVLKDNQSLNEFLLKYDNNEYGFINFRWVDYHASFKDNNYDFNFFTRWKYREKEPRPQSKIIYKWSIGCKHGHGNHLLISKRKQLAEIPIEHGFYAHFVNREREQIAKKRIRIGEAFIEKYGYDSEKPQILEYKQWKKEGDIYFDNVWEDICKKRKDNFENYIYDPINPNFFK